MEEAKPRKQRITTSQFIDQTKPAPKIVKKFGGLSRFCAVMGMPTSTVHRQMKRGFFPNRLHEESGLSLQAYIISKGREHGVEIDPAEFIETEVQAA